MHVTMMLRGAAALCATLLLSACERVVSVEVAEGPKRLVVEARLERVQTRVDGRQRIRLTTTDSYFSNRAQPAARGALVQVRDASGTIVRFVESTAEPGVYETDALVVVVNQRYTLRIDYEGARYESTEVALPVVSVDSLYFAQPITSTGPSVGLRATIVLQDPPDVENFYVWDQLVDGRRIASYDSTSNSRVVASDDFLDGQRVFDFQPYEGVVVRPGQQVLVRQAALSERLFRYFRTLSEQGDNDGSPFAVPSASVRGNVANLTTPSRPALGYFQVTEVSEASARVP